MSRYNNQEDLITFLYKSITTKKDIPLLKDTTRVNKIKFDAYVDSTISSPLSFTVFELSDKGELLIDNPTRLMESEAASGDNTVQTVALEEVFGYAVDLASVVTPPVICCCRPRRTIG